MKKFKYSFITIFCLLSLSFSLAAQEKTISQEFKAATIESLCNLMNDRYVFPEVAKKTETHLKEQLSNGYFSEIDDLETFAKSLTTSVQSVNHDKHMRIRPARRGEAPINTPESMSEDILNNMERRRSGAAGFNEISRMEGNVGYLDLRGFAGPDIGIPMADSYMKLIADTDAVIIDLRKNGGGSPRMVQYLCSYFFDDHRHLNSLYWREGDQTEEFWTLENIGGDKMPDVPLFILTSSYTFSGAEEFSYNMQTQKRATLVGETTGGGANPGGSVPINEELSVFIPTGKAINPITQKNWEGTGVEPEVKTTSEEALEKAHKLAQEAAEKYRKNKHEKYSAILDNMHTELIKYNSGESNYQNFYEKISKCREEGLLTEYSINNVGYNYLLDLKKPSLATIILKANTELYPNSANTYDSYGEALVMNNEKEKAIEAYKKAVLMAEKNDDPNLELFENNLKKAQKIGD